MLVVYGTRRKLKIENSLGVQTCPNCRYNTEQTLAKEKCHAHIYYIPIFFYTGWRFRFCPNCGIVEVLSKSEYKTIKRSLENK